MIGILVLCLTLGSSLIEAAGGTIVTDGFISQFVPRSPDLPDPNDCRRVFNVYLPAAFFEFPDQTFPIVYHVTGLGGNFTTYSESDKAAMDMMLAQGQINPIIIVAPDPRVLNYDGSFYVNSILNGQFERYIVEELIPFVDTKYRQKKTASGNAQPFRAMMGQSMGGYASLYYGIKHPDLFVAYAGDSPTSFWLINPTTPFPENNPMFTFNKLLIPELPADNTIAPSNGDLTFGFYSWAAAFSPVSDGPAQCSTMEPACKSAFPFCVAYPFRTNANGTVVLTNQSFVRNDPIANLWHTFDPFALLDTADPEKLKRQAIYLDAGNNPVTELIDNVGAHYFSQKLSGTDLDGTPSGLDINHEYLLFEGGHVTCTTIDEIDCYRFTTNLKTFDGKFSEAGIFAPDVRTKITGVMTINLADNAVMSINNKQLVGIETVDADTPQTTDITFNITDSARLEIGNETTLGGALQVGNAFGKANLIAKPVRLLDTISCTFNIEGPGAILEIGRQGFLGFGVGIDGNQTDVPNFWGCSSLTNVVNVTLNLRRGRFMNNQIASSLDPRAALLALGDITGSYNFFLDPLNFVIAGGANLAKIQVASLIHPTVLETAGTINPGGIRNKIDPGPPPQFDEFYGPPRGRIDSETFYRNLMEVSIFASSTMLVDRNKTPLPQNANVDQFFAFLSVEDYLSQATKQATIADFTDLRVGYIVEENGVDAIKRPSISLTDPCSPAGPQFPLAKILQEGAVGIKLATIAGMQAILRLYDLDPDIKPLPTTNNQAKKSGQPCPC